MSAPAGDDLLRVQFERAVYSLETLQKAALKFTNVCSFAFETTDSATVVSITRLRSIEVTDLNDVARLFQNEVLDQHLRWLVAKETEAERNLILSYAFSNTKLIDQ